MLRDDNIDALVNDVVAYQIQYEVAVMTIIAKRLKKIYEYEDEDLLPMTLLFLRTEDIQKIERLRNQTIRHQLKSINHIIEAVGEMTYNDKKSLYKSFGVKQTPYRNNKAIQECVREVAMKSMNTFVATSKPQAFMLRNPLNRKQLIPTPLSKAYTQIIDSAVSAISNNKLDKETVLRDTIKMINDSGIRRVTYEAESGRFHTQRLDTAVRRNLYDGIRAVSQNVEYEVGRELGTDGVELTVHEYPAPDHAPVQGRQFSNEEFDKMQNGESFVDYTGKHFDGFKRAIGTLNCRHFVHVIHLGDKPIHSESDLKAILERNEKGYTLPNGNKLTMYKCTQYQRRMETELRYLQEGMKVAKEAGLDSMYKAYKAKYNQRFKEYATFSKACGLGVVSDRLRIC